MNHQFTPSRSNPASCDLCPYPEDKHGHNAECDCCNKRGELHMFGDAKTGRQMLLHTECMEREKAFLETQVAIHNELRQHGINPIGVASNGEDRVLQQNAIERPYQQAIASARKLDEQLHLDSDIFTAKTVAIEEIRQTIWADDSIPPDQKFFELVSFCKTRIQHFQKVIFDLDKAKIEAYSEQKAWHVYMNQYANKLRLDERERLKIQDINYDVKMPKPVSPKKIQVNTKNNKTELRNAVNELNKELGMEVFKEFQVATIMTSKGWTVEQAIGHLRRSIKEGQSESSN